MRVQEKDPVIRLGIVSHLSVTDAKRARRILIQNWFEELTHLVPTP